MYSGTLNITSTTVNGTLTIQETEISSQLNINQANFQGVLSMPIGTLTVVDFNSSEDKTNKWVIGKDIPEIVNGGGFLGFSTVAQPATEEDFSPIIAAS